MTRCFVTPLLIAAVGAFGVAPETRAQSTEKPADAPPVTAATATSPLDFTMTSIDGKEVPLSKYRGKVVLIVNVASKCGMTPQYKQLQELHAKYADKGLAILAFPANNFGGQEPGTNDEIKAFCTSKYGVGFDLFAKVSVKGDDCCELYKYLTSAEKNGEFGKEIEWNFTKFLVERNGRVVARFGPRVKPDAEDLVKAIAKALETPQP